MYVSTREGILTHVSICISSRCRNKIRIIKHLFISFQLPLPGNGVAPVFFLSRAQELYLWAGVGRGVSSCRCLRSGLSVPLRELLSDQSPSGRPATGVGKSQLERREGMGSSSSQLVLGATH